MRDGQSVQDHCLTMIKDMEELEKLSMKLDLDLQNDIILQSLIDAYGKFIMNYHMHKLQNFLAELMNMLVTAELSMKDSKGSVLAMEWTSSKRKSYGKKKKVCEKAKDGRSKEEEGRAKDESRCQRKVFPLQQQRPLEAELPYLHGHPEEQEGRSFWRYAHY